MWEGSYANLFCALRDEEQDIILKKFENYIANHNPTYWDCGRPVYGLNADNGICNTVAAFEAGGKNKAKVRLLYFHDGSNHVLFSKHAD